MKKFNLIACCTLSLIILLNNSCQKGVDQIKTGTLKITFTNTVKGAPLVLNTGVYTNPFSETYTISKFKYYISNIGLNSSYDFYNENESYHLVDAANAGSKSFSFQAKTNAYFSLALTIGVDSLRNVSGAQTGALDPTKDMFWTWSTGYIMAKIEGNSPFSTQVNNKVEYHIGGFSGTNNVLQKLTIILPVGKNLNIREGKTSEIFINADLDKWWQNPNNLKITVNPVCTTPGTLAKQITDNYAGMFTITDVINY